MQTVVETEDYLTAAKHAGISDADREEIVTALAASPGLGDAVVGLAGVRKVRNCSKGTRQRWKLAYLCTIFDDKWPVILLSVISKRQAADLTSRQQQRVESAARAEKQARRTR